MLANHQIKRRESFRDESDIQRIRSHFRECCMSIECCVQKGEDISVSRKDIELHEVVKALHLIGFELGEEFETDCPRNIGYGLRYRRYLVPT